MTTARADDLISALADELPLGVGLDSLRRLLDAMPLMVGLFDVERRMVFANRACGEHIESASGRSDHPRGGMPCDDLFRIPPTNFARALAGETERVEGWVTSPDGTQRYMSRVVAPHRAADGTVSGVFALSEDATERRRHQDDLFRMAYYEPITGLGNRQLLLKHLADYRVEGEPFTLIMVEIDRYQEIRTSLGQAYTDELLCDLSQRLARDAGVIDLIARTGDNAFVLLIGGSVDATLIERRLVKIAAIVRSARSGSGSPVFLSSSIGVARGDPKTERVEDTLRDAEIAAARARESGGGRPMWFDPSMHSRVVEQVSIEHDLRRALEREEELWLAYQPIVDLVTGRLAGFEALARWSHRARGELAPVTFIGIAESTGLIVSLGKWVLREACRQFVEWRERRPIDEAPLFMSVNLSPRQIADPEFLDGVRAILRETGCDPEWLKLEITESAVMEHTERAIATLRALRALGIKVSIDDFGTGYSSLSYLHRLPIDNLKIDRAFIAAMHNSDENRAIVRIIVDLARLLGFDVIAEGIETPADANMLRALAVDYGQGFLYARPLRPADAEKLLSGDPPWKTR